MNARKRIAAMLCLLIAIETYATEAVATLAASSAREASAPRIVGSSILFTYSFGEQSEGRIHTVLAAFEHEAFRAQHAFQRNEQGVFVYLLPVPRNMDRLVYRIVVDGIWTTDPANPFTITDRWGVSLSTLDLPTETRRPTSLPVIDTDGTVRFMFDTTPGSNVALVGSFNGWDPFLTPMTEVSPGEYVRELALGPGEHMYYFLVNGRRLPDPMNRDRRRTSTGQFISVVVLPR